MNEYVLAVVLDVVFIILMFGGFILSYFIQHLWAWIDDAEPWKYNYFIHRLCRLYKCELAGEYSGYSHKWASGEKTDGEGPFFTTLAILLISPWIVLLSIKFYPVALAIAGTFALAHLTRFTRRFSKRFQLHVKDPNAHKTEE